MLGKEPEPPAGAAIADRRRAERRPLYRGGLDQPSSILRRRRAPPAPFGPRKPKASPCATDRERSATAIYVREPPAQSAGLDDWIRHSVRLPHGLRHLHHHPSPSVPPSASAQSPLSPHHHATVALPSSRGIDRGRGDHEAALPAHGDLAGHAWRWSAPGRRGRAPVDGRRDARASAASSRGRRADHAEPEPCPCRGACRPRGSSPGRVRLAPPFSKCWIPPATGGPEMSLAVVPAGDLDVTEI